MTGYACDVCGAFHTFTAHGADSPVPSGFPADWIIVGQRAHSPAHICSILCLIRWAQAMTLSTEVQDAD